MNLSASPQRDRESTHARILSAAKRAFAAQGYGASNIRDIASEAGITAALVIRYFGSKQKLFEASIADAFDLKKAFESIERQDFGAAMARMLFSEQREDDQMAIVMRAVFDPAVNAELKQVVHKRMLEPLAALLDDGKHQPKASMILAIVTGVWVHRFAVGLGTFQGKSGKQNEEKIAALIQAVVDQSP
jgi:AcrR family transcriptional regulator